MINLFLESALYLADLGFHVFPLYPDSKIPSIKKFSEKATRDIFQIRTWWNQWPQSNIGIATNTFAGGQSLIVVDIDCAKGKKGFQTLGDLILEGKKVPETYSQTTASGGKHLIYRYPHPVKQGTSVLGEGLDIRSRGGYIVGPGSIVKGKKYSRIGPNDRIEMCPEWIAETCGFKPEKIKSDKPKLKLKDPESVKKRAIEYLQMFAPHAVQGSNGDQTTFTVAARVKDFGVDEEICLELLLQYWNENCSPPWEASELKSKVENAYEYGERPQGIDAPEMQFDEIIEEVEPNPVERLNRIFAFVSNGSTPTILREVKGIRGENRFEHLSIQSFKALIAAQTLSCGDGKTRPLGDIWLRSPDRKSFDGFCFSPNKEHNEKYFNFWRGFRVDPPKPNDVFSAKAEKSLKQFLEHAAMNVCDGDLELFNWLMGYFAHLVQKPWEKPLTALVFKGKKGVGKNALVDRIGYLLGNHYLVTSDRRYLLGNFNSHLENCLLFTLDEAFWSGDKQAEGVLKTLITGNTHNIEHKGKESFPVDNLTRVCILGNEEWLVPASDDERRYAVFDVGNGRRGDLNFFRSMREGMEEGGARLLLSYLQNFDISKIEINEAPQTEALLSQKLKSLNSFSYWLFECLKEGKILGLDFTDEWPRHISKENIRFAFQKHTGNKNEFQAREIGQTILQYLPSTNNFQKVKTDDGYKNCYTLPQLEQARREFSAHMGHVIQWIVQ